MNNKYKEILFQVILHIVVFTFYSFDRHKSGIEEYRIAYFINYAIAAGIINYVGLALFYKKKNWFKFIGIVIICVLGSVLVEEFILEKIYFTGPRAEKIKLFWAFIEIIPIVAILTGGKFGWDALMKQNEVEQLKDAVKDSELQFLKSQINPHFLFNNLNNLYAYALEGNAKTPEIILELSGLLRYMLYECKDEFVSLTKEIEQLKNFVNLNELQIEKRGIINFAADDKSFESYKIAPLILVVFVENAFKHSLSSQSEGISIDIDLRLTEDGTLHFSCTNSYQDVSNNDNLTKGIGLENVKKRLDLVYPKTHQLVINDSGNSYKVELILELKKLS